MAEDAGKKDEIREFLKRVNNGIKFVEDIWIEREVKQRGSDGSYNLAQSLSGRTISNITELLTDDLAYSFDDGNFVFRFIAAVPGSGKTTMLDYLRELIQVESRYRKYAVVVQFPFNELLSEAGNESFGVKFYSYVLVQTFWELMRNDNAEVSEHLKHTARKSLSRIIGEEKVAQLSLKADYKVDFTEQLSEYFSTKKANFKVRFFDTIRFFVQSDPHTTFVYLMDELDGLRTHENYLQDARSIVRDLINEALGGDSIRLMIYMVGISDDVKTFIKSDQALYSRVSDSVINLVAYRVEECNRIRDKIQERIKAAYSGCQDFDQAWQEVTSISLEPSHDYSSLRDFCKKFSGRVIEIHERYFNSFDQSFNKYESRARQLVETHAKKKWEKYLGNFLTEESSCSEQLQGYLGHKKWKRYKGKGGYSMLVAKTTTQIQGLKEHALDCYAELYHNGYQVARAYGEAKNYPLSKGHVDTFQKWLSEFNYKPYSEDENIPSDIAFIISPSATDLQRKKLLIRNIDFIEEEKIDYGQDISRNNKSDQGKESKIHIDQNGGGNGNRVSLNLATLDELKIAFGDSRFRSKTFDRIVDNRPYDSFEDLLRKTKFGNSIKKKLKIKLDSNQVSI